MGHSADGAVHKHDKIGYLDALVESAESNSAFTLI